MTERIQSTKPEDPAPSAPEPPRDTLREAAPGSPKWFWRKRLQHLPLWIMPTLPVVMAVSQFIRPTANVRLTDAQEAVLNRAAELSAGTPTTMQRALVTLDDPSLAERALASAPSLAVAAVLAFMAYSLWRVEINMSFGKPQRPFTEKDCRMLGRSAGALTAGFFLLAALEAAGIGWLHGYGLSLGVLGGTTGDSTLMLLMLSLMAATTHRIYKSGKKAYESLEEIV